MELSIIIPNLNSPIIDKVLDALCSQITDKFSAEILVVGVDKPGLVRQNELVRFIPTDESANAAINRNIGIEQAHGELLLFIDADCQPTAGWLECHIARHIKGEQVVGGAVTFGTDNYFQLSDNVSAFHDLLPFTPEGPRPYLATANLSINRDVLKKAGCLNPDLPHAHDLEWTVRFRELGYRLYFDPRAVVVHDPPRRTLAAVWKHWVDNGPDTLKVRLRYAQLLNTPYLAAQRWLFLWAAPIIAAWATIRTFQNPHTIRRYWYTWPMVFLTKIAWCWGAYWNFPI